MIDVVLPVLNEAAALPVVLERVPRGYRSIVVDNGSVDGSAAVARAHGAYVIQEPRRGFGAACFAGLCASEADVVAFMDCDGSLDPAELPSVVGEVLDDRLDLALGSRQPTTRGAWPWHARLANRALAVYVSARAAPVTDLGPMRAARRQRLLDLAIRDRRFGWPLEMVLRAARADWRIGEIPVAYAPRIGRSKITGTLRGTILTVRDMAAVR
ncbi:MAG: glycosyltransferase family 2 protein [Acidimicrobiia bacterium]